MLLKLRDQEGIAQAEVLAPHYKRKVADSTLALKVPRERTPGGTILLGEPNLEESEECPPPADGPNHEGASYDKKRGACYREYLLSVHAA